MFSVSSCNFRFDNELYFLGVRPKVRLHKRHLFTNSSALEFHWSMFDLFSLFQQKKLRSEWTDPKLNEDDKFLVNFLLKKQYLDEDKRWVLHLSCARVFNIFCSLVFPLESKVWLEHWTILQNHALIAFISSTMNSQNSFNVSIMLYRCWLLHLSSLSSCLLFAYSSPRPPFH